MFNTYSIKSKLILSALLLLLGTASASCAQGLADYTYNPVDFQDNMNMTGILALDGDTVFTNQWKLGAFRNGACHGVADPIQVGNRYLYFMTVLGNPVDYGQPMSFRMINTVTGEEATYAPDPEILFVPNSIHGSVSNPYLFAFSVPCVAITNDHEDLVTATYAELSWDVGGRSYPGFELKWKSLGATSWESTITTDTFITITDLTPNADYEWQMRDLCQTPASQFGWTVLNPFKTLKAGCTAPDSFTVTNITDSEAYTDWVNWGDGTLWQLAWREDVPNVLWSSKNVNSIGYQIKGLLPGRTYNIKIKDRCKGGGQSEHGWSQEYQFNTPILDCLPPENIMVDVTGPETATVSWDATMPGQSLMIAYRKPLGKWFTKAVTTDSKELTGLKESTLYELKVKDRCNVNNGSRFGWSELVNFTTDEGTCTAPGFLSIVLNNVTIDATFSWSNPRNVPYFQVSYRELGSTWKVRQVHNANSFVVTDLDYAKTYEWRVRDMCYVTSSKFGWQSGQNFTTPAQRLSESIRKEGMLVHNNPFSDQIELSNLIPTVGNKQFSLRDLQGRVITKGELVGSATELNVDLSSSNLPKGMYLLNLQSEGYSKTIKLMRARE